MPIIRKVGKLGHSYDVRIPKEIMRHLGINRGDYVVWTIGRDSHVIFTKLNKRDNPGFFIPGSGSIRRNG